MINGIPSDALLAVIEEMISGAPLAKAKIEIPAIVSDKFSLCEILDRAGDK